jgi:hypothetical protein
MLHHSFYVSTDACADAPNFKILFKLETFHSFQNPKTKENTTKRTTDERMEHITKSAQDNQHRNNSKLELV